MTPHQAILIYQALMEDVKRRIACLRRLASGDLSLGDERLSWELASLQLRMLLESVAFASLSAHRDTYSRVHAKFATHWKAALLLKELAAIHPHFYPQPIRFDHLLDAHFIQMQGIDQLWVVQMAGGPNKSVQVAVAEPRSTT